MELENYFQPSEEYYKRKNDLLMTFEWLLKEVDGKKEFCLAGKNEKEIVMNEINNSPVVNLADDEIFDHLPEGVRIGWFGIRLIVTEDDKVFVQIEAEKNETGKKRKAFILNKEDDYWRIKTITQEHGKDMQRVRKMLF